MGAKITQGSRKHVQRVKPDPKQWSRGLIDYIVSLGWAKKSAGEIELILMGDASPYRDGPIPSKRTIGYWIEHCQSRDPSGNWTLSSVGSDRNADVLRVLSHVVTATKGGTKSVTNAEARWIAAISTVAPDLLETEVGRWQTFLQAHVYAQLDAETDVEQERSQQPDRIASDAFLAFAPWRSPEAGVAYMEAIEQGWIPKHPRFRPTS